MRFLVAGFVLWQVIVTLATLAGFVYIAFDSWRSKRRNREFYAWLKEHDESQRTNPWWSQP